MVTGVSLAVTSANIALFSKKNENSLADSLMRLASGKRINQPSDGISDFFYSERLKRNSWAAENVLKSLEDARAFTDVALQVGESVFNALTDMRELAKMYYQADTTDNEKTAYAAEFAALRDTVTGIVKSSRYDGKTVMSDNGGTAFKRVVLDEKRPDTVFTVQYTAGDIANTASLTLGVTDEASERGAVENELVKAGSYLAKTSAYNRGLNAHYSLAKNKQQTESDSAQRIVEVSTGEEYAKAMNHSIRNQSSMAMLAQANMYRMSVLQLFA